MKEQLLKTHTLAFFVILTGFFLFACDPDGKKKCDWTLDPEPSLINKVEFGYIPVCARNLVTKKQDCRLQAKLDYAKQSYGKKFRYVDIEVKSAALPRTITSITFCN